MRIGLIGYGNMGKHFADILKNAGHEIIISSRSRPDSHSQDEALSESVVLLATPISVSHELLTNTDWREDQLIINIASVQSIFAAPKCSYLGIHPLWGPQVTQLENQRMIICHDSQDSRAQEFIALFKNLGVAIEQMLGIEHDRRMAFSQVLPLATNMNLLLASYSEYRELRSTVGFIDWPMTPAAKASLVVAHRYLCQILSSTIYDEILTQNPYSDEVLRLISQTRDSLTHNIIKIRSLFKAADLDEIKQIGSRINLLIQPT